MLIINRKLIGPKHVKGLIFLFLSCDVKSLVQLSVRLMETL